MTALPRCPVCRANVDPETTPAMPFCSERCRQIDLGRWLDERYTIPLPDMDDERDADAPPAE